MITFTGTILMRSLFSLALVICTLSYQTAHTMVLVKPKTESKRPSKPAAAGSFVDHSRPAAHPIARATPVERAHRLQPPISVVTASPVVSPESVAVTIHHAPPPSAPHASVSFEGFPYDILAGSDLDVRGEGVPLLSHLCDAQAHAVSPAAPAGSVAYSPSDEAFPCELTDMPEISAISRVVDGLRIHEAGERVVATVVTEAREGVVVAGEPGAETGAEEGGEEKSVSIERYICDTLLPAKERALVTVIHGLKKGIDTCNLGLFLSQISKYAFNFSRYAVESQMIVDSLCSLLFTITMSTDEYKQVFDFMQQFLAKGPTNEDGYEIHNESYEQLRERINFFSKDPSRFEGWNRLRDYQQRYVTYFVMIQMTFLNGLVASLKSAYPDPRRVSTPSYFRLLWQKIFKQNSAPFIYLLLNSRLPDAELTLEDIYTYIQSSEEVLKISLAAINHTIEDYKAVKLWRICWDVQSMEALRLYLRVTNQTLEDCSSEMREHRSPLYEEYREALKQERAAKAAAAGPRKKVFGIF